MSCKDDEIIPRIAPILSQKWAFGGCFSSSNHLLYHIIDRYVVDGFSCDGKRLFAEFPTEMPSSFS
jgi:hypothetical protein